MTAMLKEDDTDPIIYYLLPLQVIIRLIHHIGLSNSHIWELGCKGDHRSNYLLYHPFSCLYN